MPNVFVYKRFPGRSDCRLLHLVLAKEQRVGKLFQTVDTTVFKSLFTIVDSIDDADFILLPHDYFFIQDQLSYLAEADAFAAATQKKLLVSFYSDSTEKVPLSHAIVLRTSGYRSELQPNEIIVPAFVEDLQEVTPSLIRTKGALPHVGFVGMVALPRLSTELKFQLKVFIHRCLILLGLRNSADIQGLFFRRRVISVLKNSTSCTTNFIVRNFFSADRATVKSDPEQVRKEFVAVLRDSDLSLVVRGDGNFSLRFFETLSMGRIPLFIDTDTPLPFETEIDYDSFMLRVSHRDIHKLPEIIESWWNSLTPETFVSMQHLARAAFVEYLHYNVFYKRLFATLTEQYR